MSESTQTASQADTSIFSLQDKLALVTGGGSGIGFHIAQCLVQAGARVLLTGRRESVLQEAVATLGEKSAYF
ncbi:MAG: SDR family NAD(P)-dependent oxidoreductase, partial [Bacteroidetes bacterium]|nr:SDR family NAD(P)-dependent oxidoreductase [Bacteroidota bacterium]